MSDDGAFITEQLPFAIEMLRGLPTGFSLDSTDDIRSVELMSILKNMYVSGRFNSPNVDFLIYTKAVAEMRAFLSLRLFHRDDLPLLRHRGPRPFDGQGLQPRRRQGHHHLAPALTSPIVSTWGKTPPPSTASRYLPCLEAEGEAKGDVPGTLIKEVQQREPPIVIGELKPSPSPCLLVQELEAEGDRVLHLPWV